MTVTPRGPMVGVSHEAGCSARISLRSPEPRPMEATKRVAGPLHVLIIVPAWFGLYTGLVTVTAVVGEVVLCLFLLVKGVRETASEPRATLAVAGGVG